MRTEKGDSHVIAYLEGRIDSSNAAAVQAELEAVRAQNPGLELVIDAGALAYISSAGLRSLLKICKDQGGLAVREVSPEVYEIFDMTGFTGILNVTKKLRELSVDGCEVVGRGVFGTVYRIDEDTIVKVYALPDSLPMIENEQKRAKQAFLNGIPTAISFDVVKVGENYGSVFEMLKASTYMEWLRNSPEDRERIVDSYAQFLRQINETVLEGAELPSAKQRFLECLEAVGGVLPRDSYERLRQLIKAVPESLNAVHGDCHLNNIMRVDNEPMLIDMDTLSVGNAVFELACIFFGYIPFEEDEPGNTMRIYGIPYETAEYIWNRTMRAYFKDMDEDALSDVKNRIMLLGWLFFLYRMQTDFKTRPLSDVRSEHALEHIGELINAVRELAI